MSGLQRAIYTDTEGKASQIAAQLGLQTYTTITVGGENAEFKTTALSTNAERTAQLQAAIDKATGLSGGGIVVITAPLRLEHNPDFDENLGAASPKKTCVRGREKVTLTALPGCTLSFQSGDPADLSGEVKTSCITNYGNLENFNIIDVHFDGLSPTTGADSDEHHAVYFDGLSLGGCTVKNCRIKGTYTRTASAAVRLRSYGVGNNGPIIIDASGESVDAIVQITLGAKATVENAIVDTTYAEGVLIAETSGTIIKNVEVKNSGREGFRITDTFANIGCSNILIDSVSVFNAKAIAGILIEGSENVIIDKFITEENQRHGIFIGRPTTGDVDVKNITINSGISRNNNQQIRTVPSSTDSGVRIFSANHINIYNVDSFDDQTATDALPEKTITTSSYVIPENEVYIRTFRSNPTGAGARSFTLPDPANVRINQHFAIVDEKGDASVDNITVSAPNGTINGSPSATISTNGGSLVLRRNDLGTGYETAVATQYRGIFSDGTSDFLNVTGGRSYGNLQADFYVGNNSVILNHEGIDNRIISNLDLRVRDGSDGNSLQVFYQDTINNKTATYIENNGTNHGLFIQQDGILAQDRRALNLSITNNLINTGSHGLYVSSAFNHTGIANGLLTVLQTGTTSTANIARFIDDGVGTTLFLQKNTAPAAGSSVLRLDVNGVMANADNNGLLITSSQAHTNATARLLRVFQGNVASVSQVAHIENEGTGHSLFIQQDGILATNQRGVFISLNSALANPGTSGLTIVSAGINTSATSSLLSLDNQQATSVNRVLDIADSGTSNSLFINKQNSPDSGAYAARIELNAILNQSNSGGIFVVGNQVDTAGQFIRVLVDNPASVAIGLEIDNDGTGSAINIVQDGILASNERALDIRVNSLLSATTNHGLFVYTNVAQSTVASSLAKFHSDEATSDNRVVEIQDDGIGTGLLIDKNGISGAALSIDTEATTGEGQLIDASALTTGTALRVYSNSADISARNLLSIVNDNVAAVGTTPLNIQQDALVSTNFKLLANLAGVSLYISNGTTTPNGNLTGVAGDICFNGPGGQLFYCTGTTNWIGA